MSLIPDLTPTSLRLLIACWANAVGPTATAEPYTQLWTRLRTEHGWGPTSDDAPLKDVQDWLVREGQEKLRGWLETHLREEEE